MQQVLCIYAKHIFHLQIHDQSYIIVLCYIINQFNVKRSKSPTTHFHYDMYIN